MFPPWDGNFIHESRFRSRLFFYFKRDCDIIWFVLGLGVSSTIQVWLLIEFVSRIIRVQRMHQIGIKRKKKYRTLRGESSRNLYLQWTKVDDDLTKIIYTWPELILDINRKIWNNQRGSSSTRARLTEDWFWFDRAVKFQRRISIHLLKRDVSYFKKCSR